MAHIHFIGGEKGGVGKSLTARVLAQYMIDKQIPFLGFDTDRSHGALMRFYSGYASPVLMDRYEALDVIVEAASEQPERRILVDLAAQTHEPLVKWMEDAGVINMAEEMGMTIHYWHVMDSGKDSVDLLQKLLLPASIFWITPSCSFLIATIFAPNSSARCCWPDCSRTEKSLPRTWLRTSTYFSPVPKRSSSFCSRSTESLPESITCQ